MRLEQRFTLNDSIRVELNGLGRRHSNLSGQWSFCDFSGMLEALGAGVASYTINSTLTPNDMLCGAQLNIRALGVHDDPGLCCSWI
jgi:hypothetical protein